MDTDRAPACPNEGFAMVSTIVGWRCPICGLASLPLQRADPRAAVAARPFPGPLVGDAGRAPRGA